MMAKISNRLDALINPLRLELQQAQQQAFERIYSIINKAEKEVLEEVRFLSPEQRFKKSIQELERAEAQLLSALGSMVKAMRYLAPQDNFLSRFSPLKDVKGTVVEKHEFKAARFELGFFSRRD